MSVFIITIEFSMLKPFIKSLIIFSIGFIYSSASAQWTTVHSSPIIGDSLQNINDIFFFDKDHGIAACGFGDHYYHRINPDNSQILVTQDGGYTWDTVMISQIVSFESIIDFDENTAIVSGSFMYDNAGYPMDSSFLILRTADRGLTWDTTIFKNMVVSFDLRRDLLIKNNDSTVLIPFISSDTLNLFNFLVSRDKGLTWDTIPSSIPHLVRPSVTFLNDSMGIMSGGNDNSKVYFINGRMQISDSAMVDTLNLSNGRMFRNNSKIYLTTSQNRSNYNYIYESIDSGRTWNRIRLDSNYYFIHEMVFQDDTTFYASVNYYYGYNGILKSEDAGRTWQKQKAAPITFDSARWFLNLHLIGNDTVYVGGGHQFFATYNGGKTTVGLSENQKQQAPIQLFPNPVKEYFTIEITEKYDPTFQLYNAFGQQFPITPVKSDVGYRFNVGYLPKGVYFLHMVGEKRSAVKFIKE